MLPTTAFHRSHGTFRLGPRADFCLLSGNKAVNELKLTDSEEERTLSLVHSEAMDKIALGVGTVALFHFQGRVEVVLMDMADMGLVQLVGLDLFGLEHNPQEGVGRDLLVVDKVAEQEREGDDESLLAVWYEML